MKDCKKNYLSSTKCIENTEGLTNNYKSNYDNQFVKENGVNPFYIPLGLTERDRAIRINEAATIFSERCSEALIAVNEVSKEPDPYFSDISKAVTTNIAQICMLARNIEGRQTNIKEIQKCISDFKKISTYVKTIENHYGMTVEQRMKDKDGSIQQLKDLTNSNAGKKKTNGENNPYYESIFFVKNELLGAGADKMYDQTRGLRNLIRRMETMDSINHIVSKFYPSGTGKTMKLIAPEKLDLTTTD